MQVSRLLSVQFTTNHFDKRLYNIRTRIVRFDRILLKQVCFNLQTVSSPRAWSSYTNVGARNELITMNSVEEISCYTEDKLPYYSPTFRRRTAASYDLPENIPSKKDKKWSIGSLFRRKKKENSDSSSEEDGQKKSFLRKKKKSDKKKKPKTVGTFDHIVVPPVVPNSRPQTIGRYGHDDGILSDPTGGFGSYVGRALPKIPTPGSDISSRLSKTSGSELHLSYNSLGSSDSITKRTKRGRAKARAEARRDNLKGESSSDEESRLSASSNRKSEDNLGNHRDSSAGRKSRTARTERYIRRLSKEEENILSKEAHIVGSYKSDVENYERRSKTNKNPVLKSQLNYSNSAPLSQQNFSGLSTIPPSHSNLSKHKSDGNKYRKPPTTIKSSYLDVPNEFSNHRSYSCDADIHKSPSPEREHVIHAQLAITKPQTRRSNISLVEIFRDKQPPPPPPRDPRRFVSIQRDNGRPVSYSFDKELPQRKTLEQQTNRSFHDPSKIVDVNKSRSLNWHPGYRSNSEDHIPIEPLQGIPLAPRPSSVTPSLNRLKFPKKTDHPEQFQYLTDKKPRSRKPILIQTSNRNSPNQESAQSALNFWKQKDQEQRSQKTSPKIFTSQIHVRTNIFLPSVLKQDLDPNYLTPEREASPFKPISPSSIRSSPVSSLYSATKDSTSNSFTKTGSINSLSSEKPAEDKRKSSNLEDALDELEAIYNSLHLGDEDLLERAEQREKTAAAQKFLESKSESFPGWSAQRGTSSDSNFSYEPFDSVDSPRRKRFVERSGDPDRKTDDMAFRKLNKDRSTISDPQSVISSVSYLLATPLNGVTPDEKEAKVNKNKSKEPDITFDDVVFRSIKHSNNTLKVIEPQPPFGIPIGPIAQAANSDYLHAVPDVEEPKSYKVNKIPDVVKDDLAYRNLRKDINKEPALPPLTPEDFINNNSFSVDNPNSSKKKRAVRSLSANIYNLMHKEPTYYPYNETENEFKKMDNLDDIADAMEIARQILRQKEEKINATKRAFLSDTDMRLNRRKEARSKTSNESRLNFLNDMNFPKPTEHAYNVLNTEECLSSRPPRGQTPERKPENMFPFFKSNLGIEHSSLEDLLDALTAEAKETSEKLASELQNTEHKIKNTESLEEPKKIVAPNRKLSDIEAVSEHAKLCEKLLECVGSTEETTESAPFEEVQQIEPVTAKTVANVILASVPLDQPKTMEVHSESEHDYENCGSEVEIERNIPFIEEGVDEIIACKSPFEERKAELIAGFQELNRIDLDADKKTEEQNEVEEGENLCVVASDKVRECVFCNETKFFISDCGRLNFISDYDIYVDGDDERSSNKNMFSDSLKSPRLVLDSATKLKEKIDVDVSSVDDDNISSRSSSKKNDDGISCLLNSSSRSSNQLECRPANRRDNLFASSTEVPDDLKTASFCDKLVFSNCSIRNASERRQPVVNVRSADADEVFSRDSRHTLDTTSTWACEPLTLALACSFGLACTNQTASFDVVTLLGLVFVIISFIAAVIL